MNKTIKNINNQSGATIRTLYPNPVAQAFIYCHEQRANEVDPTVKAIDDALDNYMEEHEDEDIFYSFHEFTVVGD